MMRRSLPAAPPGPSGGGGRPAGARRRHRASRAGKGRARPAVRGGDTRSGRAGRSRPLRVLSDKELLIRPCPGRPPPGAPLRSALTERHSVNLGRARWSVTRDAVPPAESARLRTFCSNGARCYAKAGAGRPSAPRKGGSPGRRRRGPRYRARRARRAAPAATAASAARTTREVGSRATISTRSDPQVPPDPTDT